MSIRRVSFMMTLSVLPDGILSLICEWVFANWYQIISLIVGSTCKQDAPSKGCAMPRAIYEPPSTTSPPDSPRLPLCTTTLSLEEIGNLTYKKALRHVKKLGVDTTHLKVLEDMQDFLKSYYHPSPGPDNNTVSAFWAFKYIVILLISDLANLKKLYKVVKIGE